MKESQQLPIFVYGSLKVGKHNHSLYLEGKVKGGAKKGRIKASLYDLPYKGYPAVISDENNMSWVYGEVYNLIDFEETITALDNLENYYGQSSFNNEYVREINAAEVWNADSNKYDLLEVFVYFYCEKKDVKFLELATHIKEGSWPKSE
ncbi:gamma-glutamylcyclotransferase family protein [Carnobacterium sp.]|uniref:gamma-glutamylcyclotransferase family protein n=1 Tax=Carnobacterium sp. TaxID=48221 RepID=UPI003C78586F